MNLENLNLVELNSQELQSTDGGSVPPTFWPVYGLYLAMEIAGSPVAHYNAFMEGYNTVR